MQTFLKSWIPACAGMSDRFEFVARCDKQRLPVSQTLNGIHRMLNTPRSRRGMVTSPHHLASEAGLRVLREGGNAIEATLAMAAVDFALRAARERSASAAWLAILAAALMTAGKGFNLLLLLPWGLAILPATVTLLRRPFATFLVGMLAIVISLVPTAVLNDRYCGDWKGIKAEPVNLSTGEPLLHLGVNGALIVLHNLNPTINPVAGVWNGWVERAIPVGWTPTLSAHFENSAAKFQLAEMQMEETAGLGCGISLLLLPLLFRWVRPRRRTWSEWSATFARPACLVPAGTLLVVLYFFTQSGLACPARYLAPSYVMLLAPVLCLPSSSELLQKRWWKTSSHLK